VKSISDNLEARAIEGSQSDLFSECLAFDKRSMFLDDLQKGESHVLIVLNLLPSLHGTKANVRLLLYHL